MALLRYSEPISRIDEVRQGMGGITGANADLPNNLPGYIKMHLSGRVKPDSGLAPGHNPMYGSVGNDGSPVRAPEITRKPVDPFSKGKFKHA